MRARLALAVVLTLGLLALAAPAFAGSGNTHPKNVVRGKRVAKGPSVLGTTTTQPAPGAALPFTGAQLTGFVLVGLGAIATGTLIVRRSRARAAA